MRTFLRGKITLLFMTCAVLIAIPAIALADIVTNNLDATVDNTAEVMTLEEGGANGTSRLYVNNQNIGQGDTNNACNLAGTSNLQLDVTSSDPTVATVSPASVTINDCATATADNGVTLTVSPVAEGSTTITVARKAGTTSSAPGTFDFRPATFTVNVTPPPNSPPSVEITGVTAGANYEINDVPTAICNVTDEEDGNSQSNATLTGPTGSLSSYGLGQVEASCSYEDAGGETATDSLLYNIVDTGKPVITDQGATTTANGDNGWYTSAVTNTFKAQDFNGTTPTPDAGAGFAGQPNPYTFTKGSGTAEGSAVTIASGTVSDVAGNEGASINSGAFKIDLSDPTNVQFSGGPDAGGSYFFGDTPAAPTCTADDAISGLNKCVVTGYSSAVGNHTMTATATDNAGRTTVATRSYTVKPYTLNGFYQPIDMNDTVNTVKNGSTVAVKFELFKGATELTSTSAVTSIKYNSITCGALAGDPEDAIETVATGGTSLRYDATAGQFIYNWTTPKGASQVGKCYTLTMTAADSSSITAYFKLK
jgi:hypothetical protein